MQAVTWAIVSMLLPRVLGAIPTRTPRTGGVGDTLSVAIVCHDLQSVEVTWGTGSAHHGPSANLSLEFRYGNQVPRPCPHYFLLDSVTAGCVLPMGAGLLEVVLRGGGGAKLFSRRKKASAWLRPRPPWNITLSWVGDTVAVSCPAHPYPGLEYEVQHKDDFDPEWQSTPAAPSLASSRNIMGTSRLGSPILRLLSLWSQSRTKMMTSSGLRPRGWKLRRMMMSLPRGPHALGEGP